MSVDYQVLFNIVLGVGSAAVGWILRVVWAAIASLQEDDKILTAKVAAIETLVAGQYVKLADHRADLAVVAVKLDRLADKQDEIIRLLGEKANRGER